MILYEKRSEISKLSFVKCKRRAKVSNSSFDIVNIFEYIQTTDFFDKYFIWPCAHKIWWNDQKWAKIIKKSTF